jgi:putative transposase
LVYNLALEAKKTAWQCAQKNISPFDLINQLPELKKSYPWMKEISSQSMHSAIRNMGMAYDKFFSGSGFPKFKKKSGRQSYPVPKPLKNPVDFANQTVSLPKIFNVKAVLSRKFKGEIRSMTVSRLPTGKYFVSILVRTEDAPPIPPKPKSAIGIDLGINHFAVLSTGIKIENPRYLRRAIDRLKILQRRASKKKKGSKNKKKALLKVAKLHEYVVNQRNDFLHKVSSGLIRDNQTDTICLETLAVSNMIQNRKLSRAISDVGWSEFVRQLEYKGRWYGKNIVRVDRFYASSKTCSTCGHIMDTLPLSIREWTCECGVTNDRDVNAAINIRNSGLDKAGVPMERPAMKGSDEVGKNVKTNYPKGKRQRKNSKINQP